MAMVLNSPGHTLSGPVGAKLAVRSERAALLRGCKTRDLFFLGDFKGSLAKANFGNKSAADLCGRQGAAEDGQAELGEGGARGPRRSVDT